MSQDLPASRLAPERVRPTAGRKLPVPGRWRTEIKSILIDPRTLRNRVKQIARAIERDYPDGDLMIVSLLSGTVMFVADLLRCISVPVRLDFIGVSSYGRGTESRRVRIRNEPRFSLRNGNVLLVDDILDTGRTLAAVSRQLGTSRPKSIRTCVLLDKPARRLVNVRPDYAGFEIPDLFVVGYGLDYAERFRNLPFIAVPHQRVLRNG